jgi:hypothetical protein
VVALAVAVTMVAAVISITPIAFVVARHGLLPENVFTVCSLP